MLTLPQLQALKTYIESTPELLADWVDGSPGLIAEKLNLTASPAFKVWRTDITRDDVTGEGFDWTQVDNLTAGQARIWELIFQTQSGTINMADTGKRAGIAEAWKGTAAKVAVQNFIFSKSSRDATVLEKLLSTGTGTVGNPATMGFEGYITFPVVIAAMNS